MILQKLQRYEIKLRAVDKSGLMYIKITDFGDKDHTPNIRMYTMINTIGYYQVIHLNP